jgi:hypothetical protein
MLALALLFGIGVFWQYLFYSNVPGIDTRALPSVLQDLTGLPGLFWGSRWILLVLILSGIPLASLDHFTQRYPHPWRERLTPVILLMVVCTVVITVLLVQADQSLHADTNQLGGEGLATLRERQSSVWALILLGAPLALAIAGITWFYWSWWYTRWRRWMQLDPAPAQVEAVESSADDWFAMRQARERRQRMILVLLAASALLTAAAIASYDYVRTEIRSGELWVQPSAPAAALAGG